MEFNKEQFIKAFDKALRSIKRSESITKEVLRDTSRTVLEAVHATGDIGFVNRLIAILSPMNRKTAILYFAHFTGFSHDSVTGLFTKKSAKRYDEAHKLALEFLEDPHQNIWTWAERNIEVERKEFTVDKVSDVVKRAIKKNISQADILKAVLASGIELEALIEVMGAIIPADKAEGVLNKVSDALGFEVKA